MPSLTRRRLLGGGATVAAGAFGALRLGRGATDAALASWTPAPGTWPLRRYDPANTAYNPNATPPREAPTRRELVPGLTTTVHGPNVPLVGPDHVVAYGGKLVAYPRDGGEPVRESDTTGWVAGFGPDGRLHGVHPRPDLADFPTVVVGYGADELRETYRFTVDADDPTYLTVGSRDVYVGTPNSDVRAVDPASGRRWQVDGTGVALGDGRLYATGFGEGTAAYAPRTGLDRRLRAGPRRVWRRAATPPDPENRAGSRDATPPSSENRVGSRGPLDSDLLPAVADGRLVYGTRSFDGGEVVALDVDSGERLWDRQPLGTEVFTPAVVGDRGYTAVANADRGLVVALDLATGETIWRDEVPWRAHAPVVGGDTLVVAGVVRENDRRTGGVVRAYDRETGDVLWSLSFEREYSVDALALVEDRVLVTSNNSLYELA